jgi:hypothetical protein
VEREREKGGGSGIECFVAERPSRARKRAANLLAAREKSRERGWRLGPIVKGHEFRCAIKRYALEKPQRQKVTVARYYGLCLGCYCTAQNPKVIRVCQCRTRYRCGTDMGRQLLIMADYFSRG